MVDDPEDKPHARRVDRSKLRKVGPLYKAGEEETDLVAVLSALNWSDTIPKTAVLPFDEALPASRFPTVLAKNLFDFGVGDVWHRSADRKIFKTDAQGVLVSAPSGQPFDGDMLLESDANGDITLSVSGKALTVLSGRDVFGQQGGTHLKRGAQSRLVDFVDRLKRLRWKDNVAPLTIGSDDTPQEVAKLFYDLGIFKVSYAASVGGPSGQYLDPTTNTFQLVEPAAAKGFEGQVALEAIDRNHIRVTVIGKDAIERLTTKGIKIGGGLPRSGGAAGEGAGVTV